MTTDRDSNVSQDATSESFAQLGLLVGSFMLWEQDRNDLQPQQIENLIQWTLDLPPVLIGEENCYPRFGASASGFAHIYYTILQAKKRLRPLSKAQEGDEETIIRVFTHLRNSSTSTEQDMEDPYNDYQHFESHIDDFANYVECLSNSVKISRRNHRAVAPKMYIWLDRKDIDWWVTAIRKTLDDYFRLIREKTLTLSDVARRCEWLECSVFAPLDITRRLRPLNTVEDEVMQKRLADLVEKVYEAAERVCGVRRELRHLYLSWDLCAFDFWEDEWRKQLVHRTMLALWTAWPHDMTWAPIPPKGFSSPSLSLEEATLLLIHLLPALRRYFLLIKDAHHLSLTKLIFEKTGGPQTHYPPTFYFADPIHRLSEASAYVKNAAVRHLISNCIGYNDPHADTLSWSSLEGSMATVRGETTQMGHYKARYLLLPIKDKAIGSDLDYIVDLLTFLEYTIGLEAEDISKRAKDIESRRAVDVDTIKTVDNIIRKLARLVSTLSREALESGAEEFTHLQLLLSRVQHALEKMRGDAGQIERQYDYLINRTNEFLRETMITAPVLNLLQLPAALIDAYPYRSLRNAMRTLPDYTAQLANSSERVGSLLGLLSTAISDDERKRRERLNRWIQEFGAVIAAAALLAALPTFFPDVNAQAIFKLFGYGTMYTSNTGIIALVLLVLALLSFLLWFCVRIRRRMSAYSEPKQERGRFRKYVGQFWDLADYTTFTYEAKKRCEEVLPPLSPALYPPPPRWFEEQWDSGGANNIDTQATSILQELWSYLDSPSRTSSTNNQGASSDGKQHASEDMIAQVRILRRLIHIFVLRPDRIPLPRALCIMRYKSLQFLEKPTIGDNEFCDSLTYAEFTLDQVKSLQEWLYEPANQKWIRNNSVDMVAKALQEAGIATSPPKDAANRWQGNLSSYCPVS